jgi:hypothetical protein
MNAKSFFWCLFAGCVTAIFSGTTWAQAVDDSGSGRRLERGVREEARLISSGKRLSSPDGAPLAVPYWERPEFKALEEVRRNRDGDFKRFLDQLRRILGPEPEIQ